MFCVCTCSPASSSDHRVPFRLAQQQPTRRRERNSKHPFAARSKTSSSDMARPKGESALSCTPTKSVWFVNRFVFISVSSAKTFSLFSHYHRLTRFRKNDSRSKLRRLPRFSNRPSSFNYRVHQSPRTRLDTSSRMLGTESSVFVFVRCRFVFTRVMRDEYDLRRIWP